MKHRNQENINNARKEDNSRKRNLSSVIQTDNSNDEKGSASDATSNETRSSDVFQHRETNPKSTSRGTAMSNEPRSAKKHMGSGKVSAMSEVKVSVATLDSLPKVESQSNISLDMSVSSTSLADTTMFTSIVNYDTMIPDMRNNSHIFSSAKRNCDLFAAFYDSNASSSKSQ
jgi:hypothetical protein